MLIIYFLLGLSAATGHSDYGVSFRAENFDKSVKNIDILNHQRLRRFVKSYYKSQNVSNNKITWGNSDVRRNNFTASVTPSSNTNKQYTPAYAVPTRSNVTATTNYVNPGHTYYNINVTRPGYPNASRPVYNNVNTSKPLNPVTPGYTPYPGFNPGYPGYPAPNTVYPPPNPAYPEPNGYPWAIQGYRNATNGSFPIPNTGYPGSLVYPKPVVYPASNSSYPVPNTGFQIPNGYPASNNSYPAPNNIYPGPNNGYPAPNNGYPATNNVYPRPSNGYPVPNVYPAPNNGYPAPNNVYPRPSNGYPAPNNGYPVPNTNYPKPNTGFYAPNTTYPVPNTNYTKPNTGFRPPNGYPNPNTGFNNTASLANCKCTLPRANSTITKEERTMDACMIACNNCPYGMKMTPYGICVRDDEDE